MKLDNKVKKVFNKIKEFNGNSPDITTRIIKKGFKDIGYIYLESTSSDDKISNYLVKSIIKTLNKSTLLDNIFNNIYTELKNNIYNSKLKTIKTYDELFYYLASGYTCVFVDGYCEGIVLETKETLDRGVSEAQSEVNIKGPKDAFTENYNKNIGLIRKRIKDYNLWFEECNIGRRTKTKVSVAYIKDVAKIDKVNIIVNKIKEIDIDGILDVGYIRDFIIKDDTSSFPTTINTERPDLVCSALLEGKIAIMIENSPNIIVLPGVLNNYIHAPEDSYQKAINITMTRFLRLIAFILTIITPAIYIAIVTYNQEVIPDTLLISLALQRSQIPFPSSFAILILMIVFEILRETDMRLPSSMGTSISIVGALVLGDAAVNAGLVSPMIVIIVAITSITGLLFTDLDIVNAFRWWRLIFLAFSTTMGLVGFVCALFIFFAKLCSLTSLGTDYMTPYSPFNKSIIQDAIITKPHNKMKERPSFLSNNKKRMND